MPSVNLDINMGLSEATGVQVYISHLPQQGRLPLLVVDYSNVDDKRISGKVITRRWTVEVMLFVENPMHIFTYNEMVNNFFEQFAIKKYESSVEYDQIYYKSFRFEFIEKITEDGYELYL